MPRYPLKDPNEIFCNSLSDEVLEQYKGQCIAIVDGEIVDNDPDFLDLADRVYDLYSNKPIYLKRVPREGEE